MPMLMLHERHELAGSDRRVREGAAGLASRAPERAPRTTRTTASSMSELVASLVHGELPSGSQVLVTLAEAADVGTRG